MDDILLHQGPVRTLYQGRKARTDFALARAGNFVVVHFHGDAQGLEHLRHFIAQVHGAIDGWHGEVAAFGARTMAFVGMAFHGGA